ncbi:MAG TPA: peptidoglycan-associated lipoprotein Pal [Candidatus Acidoferrales bacterium]|nr:peptidoglycan-associated lipoprotein Pal [Candidatus Acidoferrales bacterium]
MRIGTTKGIAYLIGFLALILTVGCHHTVAKNQPSTPPPEPTPTATLAANPAMIERGQSTTLTWQTANATDITIQGLGTMPASGTRTIYPPASTTYDLVAKGPGGTGSASARVTVNAPYASRSSAQPGPSEEQLFAQTVQDVFFDYDRFNVRTDQMRKLETDAAFLKEHAALRVVIEGHCDERGSEEYNLALGDKRATAVKKALLDLGVPAQRLQTVSYGKEKPFCSQENEHCWQENRRDHFSEGK